MIQHVDPVLQAYHKKNTCQYGGWFLPCRVFVWRGATRKHNYTTKCPLCRVFAWRPAMRKHNYTTDLMRRHDTSWCRIFALYLSYNCIFAWRPATRNFFHVYCIFIIFLSSSKILYSSFTNMCVVGIYLSVTALVVTCWCCCCFRSILSV